MGRASAGTSSFSSRVKMYMTLGRCRSRWGAIVQARVPFFVRELLQACYEARRSVRDKSLHVIYAAGAFDGLPDCVRHLGPWEGLQGGAIERLKPHYRLQIAEQGFTVVYQHLMIFSAGS